MQVQQEILRLDFILKNNIENQIFLIGNLNYGYTTSYMQSHFCSFQLCHGNKVERIQTKLIFLLQLDQLYLLSIKPDSNLQEIERKMINLGKNTKAHHRINSQPAVLPSPKQNKVQSMSGVNTPAFSGGMHNKAIGFGSRIQYTTPFVSNREKDEKHKNMSDRQISFKFEISKPSPKNITEFKSIDKQIVDITQKLKLNSGIQQSSNVVPVLQSELEAYPQNTITLKSLPIKNDNYQQQLGEERKEKQYDQTKISGRMLDQINQNMKEMKQNTFKLIKVFENTHEIKTQSSFEHCRQVQEQLQWKSIFIESQIEKYQYLLKFIVTLMNYRYIFHFTIQKIKKCKLNFYKSSLFLTEFMVKLQIKIYIIYNKTF